MATKTGSSKDVCIGKLSVHLHVFFYSVSHDVLAPGTDGVSNTTFSNMIGMFKSYKTWRGEMGDDASCGQTEKRHMRSLQSSYITMFK